MLCAALLGWGAFRPASAQAPAPSDTARAYQREFGLTASLQLAHFFTANRSLPLGFIYQRQLTKTKSLRLRLVGQLSYADSTNFKDDVFGVVNSYVSGPSYCSWQVQVFAGYGW